MTDREFALEVYNGLNMIYRGLGAILAAMAKRYALGKRGERPAAALPIDRVGEGL